MSSNLTAEPVIRNKTDLGTGLKFALRKLLGEPVNCEVGTDYIPTLRGIASVAEGELKADVDNLICLIQTYGIIYLKEEY